MYRPYLSTEPMCSQWLSVLCHMKKDAILIDASIDIISYITAPYDLYLYFISNHNHKEL